MRVEKQILFYNGGKIYQWVGAALGNSTTFLLTTIDGLFVLSAHVVKFCGMILVEKKQEI